MALSTESTNVVSGDQEKSATSSGDAQNNSDAGIGQ
jgi:hypothetical protein